MIPYFFLLIYDYTVSRRVSTPMPRLVSMTSSPRGFVALILDNLLCRACLRLPHTSCWSTALDTPNGMALASMTATVMAAEPATQGAHVTARTDRMLSSIVLMLVARLTDLVTRGDALLPGSTTTDTHFFLTSSVPCANELDTLPSIATC
jgi:hypothetical protein